MRSSFKLGYLLKARSHDILFSWTFDLLLIKCIRYLVGVYFPPHQRIIVSTNSKGNHSWNKNKEAYVFNNLWYLNKFPYQQFLIFLSFRFSEAVDRKCSQALRTLFHVEGQQFSKKAKLQGCLKQLSLEKDPGRNTR